MDKKLSDILSFLADIEIRSLMYSYTNIINLKDDIRELSYSLGKR